MALVTLNYRDSKPIYEQVKDGFQRLILSGVLAAGEKLPSVRELAAELTINPNTIQRADRELEANGLIYSIPGKGSFAAAPEEAAGARRSELLAAFDETVSELLHLGVSEEDLKNRILSHAAHQMKEGGTP